MPAPVPPPPSSSIVSPPSSPYPTLQAITTTRSSAHRGDWGLKRGLPLRASHKTTYLRYRDLDTIEHMTTFESAHDDVLTLKKWQEMDIPLMKGESMGEYTLGATPADRIGYFNHKTTVFDGREAKSENYKWRYKGPYIAGMSEKELREYIKKSILPRKDEFCAYVKERQNVDMLKQKYSYSGASSEVYKTQAEIEREAALMGEKEVDMMALRDDPSRLERLVIEFLDIPTTRPYQTHTSAGLHYTRSYAYAHNDPEEGPQRPKQGIPSRRLNHLGSAGMLVGVGGVVARLNHTFGRFRPEDRFQVHKVRPLKGASINSGGRIVLDVEQATQQPDYYGGVFNQMTLQDAEPVNRPGQAASAEMGASVLKMIRGNDFRGKGSGPERRFGR